MTDCRKHNLLGVLVNSVDYDVVVRRVIQSAKVAQPLTVTALAVHGVMTGALDSSQAYRLNQLDLVVPDGQPVRWALNCLYRCGLKERVYGPTLMLKICSHAAQSDLPIYLYGSDLNTLERLSKNLEEKFPNLKIAGFQPSRFKKISSTEQIEISNNICKSGAAIVFVGLGCPRQEAWLFEHKTLLNMPTIAVGAAFNFHAGLLDQAPLWMQKRGLEWMFRLWKEPLRLWKRYLYLNPFYINLILLQLIGLKSFKSTKTPMKVESIRYG